MKDKNYGKLVRFIKNGVFSTLQSFSNKVNKNDIGILLDYRIGSAGTRENVVLYRVFVNNFISDGCVWAFASKGNEFSLELI